MNKKTKLIASVLSITVLASSIFAIASFGGNIFVRSRAENVSSITISRNTSTIKSGAYGSTTTKPLVLSTAIGNTGYSLLTSIVDQNTSSGSDVIRLKTNADSVSFMFDANNNNYFAFQAITSIEFTFAGSGSAASFNILTSSSKYNAFTDSATYTTTTTTSGSSTYTFIPSETVRSFKFVGASSTSANTYIRSVKINFSCENNYDESIEPDTFVGVYNFTHVVGTRTYNNVLTFNLDGTGTFVSNNIQTGVFTWTRTGLLTASTHATNSHTVNSDCEYEVIKSVNGSTKLNSDLSKLYFDIYYWNETTNKGTGTQVSFSRVN